MTSNGQLCSIHPDHRKPCAMCLRAGIIKAPYHPNADCKKGCGFETVSGMVVMKFCKRHQPRPAQEPPAMTESRKKQRKCKDCGHSWKWHRVRQGCCYGDREWSCPCKKRRPR